MRLITNQDLANSAAERWGYRYDNGAWGQDKIEILNKLRALGDNPSPDSVYRLTGEKSFTRTECDECGANDIDVVELGPQPEYDSITTICKGCIKKALAI